MCFYVSQKIRENYFCFCNYGQKIVSIIQKENIWGTQFHPEKSQADGLNFLKQFATIHKSLNPIRIIPCLDIKDAKVVKGKNFVDLKNVGDPLELAKDYNKQQALSFWIILTTRNCKKQK